MKGLEQEKTRVLLERGVREEEEKKMPPWEEWKEADASGKGNENDCFCRTIGRWAIDHLVGPSILTCEIIFINL